MLKKINVNEGKKILKNFIKELLSEPKIIEAFKNYYPSRYESQWIPRAFILKSVFWLSLLVIKDVDLFLIKIERA